MSQVGATYTKAASLAGVDTMMRCILAAVAATWCTNALAWDAMVKGPDVFGETTVLATEVGIQSSIVIQCKSSGDLFVAMISKKKPFDEVDETAATLFISTPPGAPMQFPAKLRSWNDNYLGVVSAVDAAQLLPLIEAIRDTKTKIQVGADIAGNRISDSFSSSGSTSAMAKVVKGCGLSPKD